MANLFLINVFICVHLWCFGLLLQAEAAVAMGEADLGKVPDVDAEGEALVETVGEPAEAGFPAVEGPVDGEALRGEVSFDEVEVNAVVDPPLRSGIKPEV